MTRRERYRKRCEDAGDAALLPDPEADNPLPGRLDPITLEPVVNPAISPYGHVMGLATWRVVLVEQVGVGCGGEAGADGARGWVWCQGRVGGVSCLKCVREGLMAWMVVLQEQVRGCLVTRHVR